MKKRSLESLKEEIRKIDGGRYSSHLITEEMWRNSTVGTPLPWVCDQHGIFYSNFDNRKVGKGCPKCFGRGFSLSKHLVQIRKIDEEKERAIVCLATEEEYEKEKTRGKLRWKCDNGHEFFQTIERRKSGRGCPTCSGRNKSLNELKEEIKLIDNDMYKSYLITEDMWKKSNQHTKLPWVCEDHGIFYCSFTSRRRGSGCTCCNKTGRKTLEHYKNLSIQKHNSKYSYHLITEDIWEKSKSTTLLPMHCYIHGKFLQSFSVHITGVGCPICANGFTAAYKLQLIHLLEDSDLLTMDPVELYTFISKRKLPDIFKCLQDSEAYSEERVATLNELKEALSIEESDDTLSDLPQLLEEDQELIEEDDSANTDLNNLIQNSLKTPPELGNIKELHLLDNPIYSGTDEEDISFLIEYKIRKLWNSILNEKIPVQDIEKEVGGEYFTRIKEIFLSEYYQVVDIAPKSGYTSHTPNLMQKLIVHRLKGSKNYGNWSGTGAGKTLSFILASREIDARLTVVVAVNSTVNQIADVVREAYADSKIYTEYSDLVQFDRNKHNYLILNYEKFQQGYSEETFQHLTNNHQIDFIVLDEVHNTKQRSEEDESIRRGVLNRLLGRARENNSNLHVLAMSATPVINNLLEAKSLLTMVTGLEYEEIETRRTLNNAINIYKHLTLNGLRFIPKYNIEISELTSANMSNLDIDGMTILDQLLELNQRDYIASEKLILDPKLEAIGSYLRKGTIIYSYFVKDFIHNIQKHVESLGYKTGTYTGEESVEVRTRNLENFISGKIDILIGSKPIGTGVDGLQGVCNRMIIMSLPWTNAEYEQLKGRIYRQGSVFKDVEIVIPQVKIRMDDGGVWSWDVQRIALIKTKKTLADAAVDGVLPSKAMPSLETFFQRSLEGLVNWKERLSSGNVIESSRDQVNMNLYPEITEVEREKIDSKLNSYNAQGAITYSYNMHAKFQKNPETWHEYHALRKSRMEKWSEIPYEYIATKITDSRDVIADFGCGENLFKNRVPKNKVYSFDHVAIDESVIACDMRNTGLPEESIDIAMFSLSLWGPNYVEYLQEAKRILRRRGLIYIAEPLSKYEDEEKKANLINTLNEIGFKIVGNIEPRGKFLYLIGMKS